MFFLTKVFLSFLQDFLVLIFMAYHIQFIFRTLELKLYYDYDIRKRRITKCDRFKDYIYDRAELKTVICFGLQSATKI